MVIASFRIELANQFGGAALSQLNSAYCPLVSESLFPLWLELHAVAECVLYSAPNKEQFTPRSMLNVYTRSNNAKSRQRSQLPVDLNTGPPPVSKYST